MRKLMLWIKEKSELVYLIFYAYQGTLPGNPFHISLLFFSLLISFSFSAIFSFASLFLIDREFLKTNVWVTITAIIYLISWVYFKNNEKVSFLKKKHNIDIWYKKKHIWIQSLILIVIILLNVIIAVIYHKLYR